MWASPPSSRVTTSDCGLTWATCDHLTTGRKTAEGLVAVPVRSDQEREGMACVCKQRKRRYKSYWRAWGKRVQGQGPGFQPPLWHVPVLHLNFTFTPDVKVGCRLWTAQHFSSFQSLCLLVSTSCRSPQDPHPTSHPLLGPLAPLNPCPSLTALALSFCPCVSPAQPRLEDEATWSVFYCRTHPDVSLLARTF